MSVKKGSHVTYHIIRRRPFSRLQTFLYRIIKRFLDGLREPLGSMSALQNTHIWILMRAIPT
eukprot:UN26928